MKLVLALVAAVLVYSTEVQVATSTRTHSDILDDVHYDYLSKHLDRHADNLNSASLAELGTHVILRKSFEKIKKSCEDMKVEIKKERTAAIKEEKRERLSCDQTILGYRLKIRNHNAKRNDEQKIGFKQRAAHMRVKHVPDEKYRSREAIKKNIASQEVEFKKRQKHRDDTFDKFNKLKAAFQQALEQISIIHRVLNGEGTLGDLHGGKGFLEEASCSVRVAKIAEDTKEVPEVSSMLQVFSKAFHKVETSGKTKGDMTAINMILAKVRENLIKSLQNFQKLETNSLNIWKDEKQDRRKKINKDWVAAWQNLKEQGTVEREIGYYWNREGSNRISAAKARKVSDATGIRKAFLEAKCSKRCDAFTVDLINKANELAALDMVIDYLDNIVFKNKKDPDAKQGRWIKETPKYITLGNKHGTFSTMDNQDVLACRTGYSTVYTKIRILTEKGSNRKFIDPSDMKHSTNVDTETRKTPVTNLQCKKFPDGIPVGRVSSCAKDFESKAAIDLTGTDYKFKKDVKRMFPKLGCGSEFTKINVSKDLKKITFEVKGGSGGRCTELYSDKNPGAPDGESDPIPVVSTVVKG